MKLENCRNLICSLPRQSKLSSRTSIQTYLIKTCLTEREDFADEIDLVWFKHADRGPDSSGISMGTISAEKLLNCLADVTVDNELHFDCFLLHLVINIIAIIVFPAQISFQRLFTRNATCSELQHCSKETTCLVDNFKFVHIYHCTNATLAICEQCDICGKINLILGVSF